MWKLTANGYYFTNAISTIHLALFDLLQNWSSRRAGRTSPPYWLRTRWRKSCRVSATVCWLGTRRSSSLSSSHWGWVTGSLSNAATSQLRSPQQIIAVVTVRCRKVILLIRSPQYCGHIYLSWGWVVYSCCTFLTKLGYLVHFVTV